MDRVLKFLHLPSNMDRVHKFIDLPLTSHLVIGLIIRMVLIMYGEFHDRNYDVPYTDVDYKVFTDAARHVLKGDSPYKRHTYRYSPIIAYLLAPYVVIGKHFGKILFSFFDILVTIAVKKHVEYQLGVKSKNVSRIATYCALFWLYNPMSIAISTRGNADSVPCFFVILSIMFMQTDVMSGLKKYALSGLLLGISIHLRLYPLAFSFPMYLSLGEYKITRRTKIKEGLWMLMPNMKQIILALSCIITLFSLTYGMYLLYKYEFLFETYIYHLFRKDTRHNFSLMFYYSYLTLDDFSFDVVKTMSQIFEFIILFVISLAFGCNKRTLCFALFGQAVVLVTFNSVITSQYFVWFLSLLPLVVHNLRMSPRAALTIVGIWLFPQFGWLFNAYLLEFQGYQVFFVIWVQTVVFFIMNIFVLGKLIQTYSADYCFGLLFSEHKIK